MIIAAAVTAVIAVAEAEEQSVAVAVTYGIARFGN